MGLQILAKISVCYYNSFFNKSHVLKWNCWLDRQTDGQTVWHRNWYNILPHPPPLATHLNISCQGLRTGKLLLKGIFTKILVSSNLQIFKIYNESCVPAFYSDFTEIPGWCTRFSTKKWESWWPPINHGFHWSFN